MTYQTRHARRQQELEWLADAHSIAAQRDFNSITREQYRAALLNLREAGCPVAVIADGLGRARTGVYEVLATARRHQAAAP